MDEWGLVPEDDMFHPPESADPWWTETVWFSWKFPSATSSATGTR